MVNVFDVPKEIELDTGSPISVISIPVLLSITGESLFAFRKKADAFVNKHGKLSITFFGKVENADYGLKFTLH